MSSITYETIIDEAWKIQLGIMKQHKLVESTKWDYYMAKAILQRHSPVKKINVDKASNIDKGNYFSRQIKRSVYLDMVTRLIAYTESHNTIPNTIRIGDKLMGVKDFTNMFSAILVYYSKHGELPKTVNVNSKAFVKPTEDTNVVFSAFVKKFGKVTTFTDALRKIWNKGYGYYFDDFLTNLQVINNLANGGQKPNCVDVCQMMWNVAKGLGYEVRCLHVYCPRDDITHVRLQVKHSKYTGGDWEDYDPAAVIDGEGINSLWCNGSGSYVIAINPNWFISNVNR